MKVKHTYNFSNGDEVKEIITGFTGVITGSVHYLTGCNQYLVAAKAKDNFTEPISNWYDEGRLELLKNESIKPNEVKASKNGCDALPSKSRGI